VRSIRLSELLDRLRLIYNNTVVEILALGAGPKLPDLAAKLRRQLPDS
jgi:hypothetical protein